MKIFIITLMFALTTLAAVKDYSASVPSRFVENKPRTVVWVMSASGDVGQAYTAPESRIVSFQSQGTFNSGRVTIEGSNDCTNYHILNDLSNTAVSMTTAAIKTVSDRVKCYRPRTQGAASLDVTTTILLSN